MKIRTSILVFKSGGAEIVCRRCGADIPLDLHPGDDLRKAMEYTNPRLVLRKKLDSDNSAP